MQSHANCISEHLLLSSNGFINVVINKNFVDFDSCVFDAQASRLDVQEIAFLWFGVIVADHSWTCFTRPVNEHCMC